MNANSPVEMQKTGKVFAGDVDLTKMSQKQVKLFRKSIKKAADAYGKAFFDGERKDLIADFDKIKAMALAKAEQADKIVARHKVNRAALWITIAISGAVNIILATIIIYRAATG